MSDNPPRLVISIRLNSPLSNPELHTTVVVEVIEDGDRVTLFLFGTVPDQPLLLLLVF